MTPLIEAIIRTQLPIARLERREGRKKVRKLYGMIYYLFGELGDSRAVEALKDDKIPECIRRDKELMKNRALAVASISARNGYAPSAEEKKRSQIIHEAHQRIVVLRLKKRTARILDAFLNAQEHKAQRKQVEKAGREVLPDWANGALLLAPLSEDEVREAGWRLCAHHIVVAKKYQGIVEDIGRNNRIQVTPADDEFLGR